MKRLICALLSLLMTVSCFSAAVWADSIQEEQDHKAFVELAEPVLNSFGFSDTTSDYEKIETVYEFVLNNISYDSDSLNHTAFAALSAEKGSGLGVAEVVKGMLKLAEISCEVISGTADGKEHCWNIVELKHVTTEGGSVYYILDAALEQLTADKEEEGLQFFLRSGNLASHVPSDEFTDVDFSTEHPMAKADFDLECWDTHYYWSGTFTWSGDFSTARASTKCVLCRGLYSDNCFVTKSVLQEESHTQNGQICYEAVLLIDGVEIDSEQKLISIDKTPDHLFGAPQWVWTPSGDGYAAKAVFACTANDGYSEEVIGEVTFSEEPGSCTKPAVVTYSTAVDFNGKTYTDTKVVEGERAAHSYEEVLTPPTCTEKGYTTSICTLCGERVSGLETEPLGHSVEKFTILAEPTAELPGVQIGTCTRCGETITEEIPALDGEEGPPEETDSPGEPDTPKDPEAPEDHQHYYTGERREATCTEPGGIYYSCQCGDSHVEDVKPALGHSFTDFTVTKVPSCTLPGELTGYCSRCGITAVEQIAAGGHSFRDSVVSPTCSEQGYTSHICTVCGYEMRDRFTEPGEHSFDQGVVTREPTDSLGGIMTYTCQICGFTKFETIYVGRNPFVDVNDGDYFYQPVLWAYENSITSGVDRTHFAPDSTCTRGQVVTFLWRTAGCPEPKSVTCPFVDVTPSDYFYRAVLWAYENGITTGMEWNRFAPEGTVNRAQVVTFLFRLNGERVSAVNNPFTDVYPVDYFYSPVLWAHKNGITSGVDDANFAPGAPCTRGQVVTFLYRASKQHN